MNEYQRTAYEAPLHGQEPAPEPDRYRHLEVHDGVQVTVMVTVDVGEEEERRFGTDAVWHVSVSCWPRPGAARPLPLYRWKRRHRQAALEAHARNARGVGEAAAQGYLEYGEYAVHLYLPLSGEERAGLHLPGR